jgi:Fur family transcriptional regulator, zinc uptake regulator
MTDEKSLLPARDHDHTQCLNGAMARAQERCLSLGLRWTELREQVFRQIAVSHKPVSAYDLIEGLAKGGKRLAPISVYRILEVLQNAGLVHRLESRNAFFACMVEHPMVSRAVTFVCDDCQRVAEVEAAEAIGVLHRTLRAWRLQARNTVIEVSGLCGECAPERSGS